MNDVFAAGALHVLRGYNLNIPHLTPINWPPAEIGRIATKILLNRIYRAADTHEDVSVGPELVVRQSMEPVNQ